MLEVLIIRQYPVTTKKQPSKKEEEEEEEEEGTSGGVGGGGNSSSGVDTSSSSLTRHDCYQLTYYGHRMKEHTPPLILSFPPEKGGQ